MKYFWASIFSVLFATQAFAVTIQYTGAEFRSLAYSVGDEPDPTTLGYELRGSHLPDDRIKAIFEFSGELPSNANNFNAMDIVESVYLTDGINTFRNVLFFDVWTDAAGSITDWSFAAFNGFGADRDVVSSLSADGGSGVYNSLLGQSYGDSAFYVAEYCPIFFSPDEFCNGYSNIDVERAEAVSFNRVGTWSVVPLPASLPLLGSGLAATFLLRRKRFFKTL